MSYAFKLFSLKNSPLIQTTNMESLHKINFAEKFVIRFLFIALKLCSYCFYDNNLNLRSYNTSYHELVYCAQIFLKVTPMSPHVVVLQGIVEKAFAHINVAVRKAMVTQ